MDKRPNIIIFNPDEMRADSLGHLGNPAAITPFLDDFARTEAVSFRNAFCQNPVCVPSRCSFTTGLYPHVHGHRTMSHLLREGEPSIFQELKDAGYYVWMNARNDLVAGQIEGLMERHASEIYYGGKSPDAPGPEEQRPGGPDSKGYYSFFNGRLGLDGQGRNYSTDDEDVDAAITCIKNHPKERPLCLFLGTIYPHTPYQVEEPYFSAIDRAKLPRRIRGEETEGKSKIMDGIRSANGMGAYTEEDWDELRACYLGMCMKVDAMFRKLCDALKEAGEYDNSAIFFFSDHGDFTGDYGLVEKAQNTFEDCLTRVPLLVKPPKGVALDPGATDSMAELVDFYATAMEMAGVKPSHTQFGRSLLPVLADRRTPNRDYVCCEGGRMPEEVHCDEFHASGPNGSPPTYPYYPRHHAQVDPDAHAKGYMLRTSRWKLVSRPNGAGELYDLENDPQELKNRYHDPDCAAVRQELEHQQLLWLIGTADVVPFDYDSRFTPEMIWARVQKYVLPEEEETIRKKIAAGAHPFMLLNQCQSAWLQRQQNQQDG